MALRDNLKYFSDYDGYNGSLTKAEMDTNLRVLADEIDKGFFEKDNLLLPRQKGTKSFSINSNGISNENNFYYNSNNYSLRGGLIKDAKEEGEYSFAYGVENVVAGERCVSFGYQNKITGNYDNFAIGYQNEITGDYDNFVIGYKNKIETSASFTLGAKVINRQIISITLGDYRDNISMNKKSGILTAKTTDGEPYTEDKTTFKLYSPFVGYFKIKGVAVGGDEIWVFERSFIVLVDSDGKVTISNDDNKDIKKDNSDWKVDLDTVDDKDNPLFRLKLTGKDDTTIYWNFTYDSNILYVNG